MTFLTKLKEQLTKITKSPWIWSDTQDLYQTSHITRDIWLIPNNEFDGPFIAKSPETISKLIELVEEAIKVIDFYGDPLTYVSNSGKVGITPIYTNDCEDIKGTTGAFRYCGGKRAREFLKKLEELK